MNMSKLKRRKTALEEIKSEPQINHKDQNESLRIPAAPLHNRADGSSVGEGSWCWTSPAFSDEERLWMKILQALCPQFVAQDGLLCFPHAHSPKEKRQYEWCWCSLDEDVIPFPNPAAPLVPPCPVPCPDLQERLDCTSGHASQSQNRINAGQSRSTTEHSGVDHEAEAGAGTSDTAEVKSRAVLSSGTSESEPDVNNADRISGRRSGSGGLRLECCPMCLMPFLGRFSQMECDGHLAQCLAEMNTDVMW